MSTGALEAPELLVVLGPTGAGKSALALALAAELSAEIVGCDSLQVYRGFDLATAKPTPDERARVPHHLVDCVDPNVDFTLADYVEAAERAIESIAAAGRLPLVVGGTGLYLRGLLRGVMEAPVRDEALRRRLRRIVERGGLARLRRRLERLDPASARRIAPSDVQRTLRALEVAYVSGTPWSDRIARDGTWKDGVDRYPSLKIGLDADRALLAERLDRRVERFFDDGLIEEVRRLCAAGVAPTANAFKAIGYREVLGALSRGEDPRTALQAVQRSTRRYSKRQRSWFRTEPDVLWLDAARPTAELARDVAERWLRRAAGGATTAS